MENPNSNILLFKQAAETLGLTFKATPTEKNKSLYSISGNGKFFYGSSKTPGFYPNATRWCATMTGNKELTQKTLDELGFNTIPSKFLRPTDFSSFADFLAAAHAGLDTFPVILKPNRGLDGRGIKYIADTINLEQNLLTYFEEDLAVIIQPILTLPEYRILIINGEIELVHSKDFRAITGDGVRTVTELLSEIADRDKHEAFIELEYTLTKHTPETILTHGQQFRYHIVKNSSFRYEKSDNFSTELLDWVANFKSKLNASTLGIDLFVKNSDFTNPENYIIIELNSNPGLYQYYDCDKNSMHPTRISTKVLKDYFEL